MKIHFLFSTVILTGLFFYSCHAQGQSDIETADIDHFWEAFDRLNICKTHEDSVKVIQENYFDRATEGLKDFTKVRAINAECIVKLLAYYPKFWPSIRDNTLSIAGKKKAMEDVFQKFKEAYPEFKQPAVCFAIGCLSTGGTTTSDKILIGSEIVASDSTVVKTELSSWLKSVMYKEDKILAFIAHEGVHTQQKFNFKKKTLLSQCLVEGGADFISVLIAKANINENLYQYGYAHEKELWEVFQKEMDGKDFSNWMYQGDRSKDKPADLGYFMGYRICEQYYQQAADKKLAIKEIMEMRDPGKIFKESGYKGGQ